MNKDIMNLTDKYLSFINRYKPENEFMAKWFDVIADDCAYIICLASDFSIMIFETAQARRIISYMLNNENFDFGMQVDYFGIGNLKFYYDDEEHLRIYNKRVGSFFKDATKAEIKKINDIIDYLDIILKNEYCNVFNDNHLMHYSVIENYTLLCSKGIPFDRSMELKYKFKNINKEYTFKFSNEEATYIDLFYFEFPLLSSRRNEYLYPYVLCISDSSHNASFYTLDYDFKDIINPILEILTSHSLSQNTYISNGILYELLKKTLQKGNINVKHIPLCAESYCTFSSLEYNIFRYLHEKGDLFVDELAKVFYDVNLIYEYCNKNSSEDGYIDRYLFETSNKYLFDLYNTMQKYDLKDIWDELENNFSIKIADTIPEPSQEDEEENSEDQSSDNLDKFEESNFDNDDVINDLLN